MSLQERDVMATGPMVRYANYINFSVPSLLPLACYIVADLLHNTTITRLNMHESIADFLLLYIVSALFRKYHFADKKNEACSHAQAPLLSYAEPVTHSAHRTRIVYWQEIKKYSEICKYFVWLSGSGLNSLLWMHRKRPLGVLLDLFTREEHRVIFNLHPHFDEVIVVLAGWMPRLARCVDRARAGQIGEIDDLAERRDRDHQLRVGGERRAHVDRIDIATARERASIEEALKWLDHAQRVVVGHLMQRAVFPG